MRDRISRTAGALLALGLLAALGASGPAQEKLAPTPIKANREWRGSLDDLELLKAAPAKDVLTDQKTFEALWKAWKVEAKVPEVDFKKELVVVGTTRGSRINFGGRLDEKGNLSTAFLATRDLRPGLRYLIVAVPREGVKTVNGKPLD